MIYAFNENFVLPLSHDEVVHEKGSLLGKMPGDNWQKFANLRALFGFMWGHPGKKLLFMGSEFGQWREWAHDHELDWHLTGVEAHAGLQRFVAQLNRVYRESPALWQLDFTPAGFEWVVADDADASVFAFLRKPRDRGSPILVVSNMTPVPRTNCMMGVPWPGSWREILNSDAAEFGGSGWGNFGEVETVPIRSHGRVHAVVLTLPPLSTLMFQLMPNA
jgi:1,4-alpha-glucan branching enzyme